MTAFLQNLTRKTAAAALQDDARVAQVLEFLRANASATTDEQIRITEIPAPPFHEGARAAYMKKLLAAAGLRVEIDGTGNVIGGSASSNNNLPRQADRTFANIVNAAPVRDE